jgi:hypothetical protein
MKITGLILIILGWLLLALNILSYLGGGPGRPSSTPDPTTTDIIAYYIGYNMPLIMAIILLLLGYRLRRKAKHKKVKADLLDNFLTDNPGKTKDI